MAEPSSPDEASGRPLLTVVLGSTRPGRVAPVVGRWFHDASREHAFFETADADEIVAALPLMDEPHHPRLQRYEHAHTLRWSEAVQRSDGLVIVTPEYNHTFTAVVKNAIDYLFVEWRDKPVGVVSYGGVSGGVRATQHLRSLLLSVGSRPLHSTVSIPLVHDMIVDQDLQPPPAALRAAERLLDEMAEATTRSRSAAP